MKSWFSKPLDHSNQNLLSYPWSHCTFFIFPLGLSQQENNKKGQSPKRRLVSVILWTPIFKIFNFTRGSKNHSFHSVNIPHIPQEAQQFLWKSRVGIEGGGGGVECPSTHLVCQVILNKIPMSSKKHQVTSFQSQMSSLHFSNSNEYRLRCLNPLKLQLNYLIIWKILKLNVRLKIW